MAEATESQSQKPPGGKGRMVPLLIVVILMAGEGVGVFLLAEAISPAPVSALAADLDAPDGVPGDAPNDYAEVELAECRPSNRMAGKFVTFHIRVTGLVSPTDLDRVEQLVQARQARLEDGVNTVIRSAEPSHFNEPGYDTIKRRLKHEFDRIFGDERLIKKVLIPQMLQSAPGV